jgi:hypothetical protein
MIIGNILIIIYYFAGVACAERHKWNITNPHYKFLRPLSETKWNMTNSIICWDLHILVTTKTNLTIQIEIMNGYGNDSYISQAEW